MPRSAPRPEMVGELEVATIDADAGLVGATFRTDPVCEGRVVQFFALDLESEQELAFDEPATLVDPTGVAIRELGLSGPGRYEIVANNDSGVSLSWTIAPAQPGAAAVSASTTPTTSSSAADGDSGGSSATAFVLAAAVGLIAILAVVAIRRRSAATAETGSSRQPSEV